ncbi:MAG: SIMPL domain-containing protein [Bacteroidia bacterium]|nr:SIMPL domain-containing protein [Bacteroidia bacterium]
MQEEETKVGYATVGKTPIDSIRQTLFTNIKKLGVDEKELKLTAASSKELGQFPGFLINNLYECRVSNKQLALKLVNDLRFAGLKGVIAKVDVTTAEKEQIAEAVYNEALADAKKTASLLAAKANKTIGEIKNIDVNANSIHILNGTDYESDNFNAYGYNRFEIDYRDKHAYCHLRVIYEMK